MDTKAKRPSEGAKDESGSPPTLGQVLITAREKLGLSRQEAAQRTHLSLSYVEMLEGESYKKVSDQIYLVPFLRRYANTLGLDGEDLAMRFVREFQYIENESARMAEPVMLETKRPTRRLSWIAILVAAIGAIALAKFGQSRYREQSPPPSAGSHSPSGAANPARPGASSANKPSSPTGLSPSAGPSAVAATQPVSNQPVGKPSANGVPSAAASAALLGPGQVPPPHGTASAKSEHQVSDPFASGDDNAANTE